MESEYTDKTKIEHEPFVFETFSIKIPSRKALANVSFRWRLSKPSTDVNVRQWFESLDLLMKIVPVSCTNAPCTNEIKGCLIPDATGTPLEQLVHAWCTYKRRSIKAKWQLRMRHSACVASVVQFSTSDGYFHSTTNHGKSDLLELLSSAPGALLAKWSSPSYNEALNLMEEELRVRFAFDWVLPTKPAIRRVALIGGRPQFDMQKGSFGHQGTFEAALALGISVVVVDRPGHWLDREKYSYLREDFIPVDMTDDAELPSRIAGVLDGKKIDGIFTLSDEFVIATAKAAGILGLPTEPVRAILNAHNKYETRKIIETRTQTLRLDNADELRSSSVAEVLRNMNYPLVVKPCRGGASRGVKKVDNYSTMCQAIRQLEETGFAKHGILLATYVDGPEVDANFVLWEGEVLFFEVSDDFPGQADAIDATIKDNFAETFTLLPSRLSAEEIELIKSSLHQCLLKLGFRTGVFHIEARVQNSSMCYKETKGILDLADTDLTPKGKPDVFLIEVNARPPGLHSVFATTYTYGVDYSALSLLRAIEDRERFIVLSNPFSRRAQYWCALVNIPVHRENIKVPDGFCEKVIGQLPEAGIRVSG